MLLASLRKGLSLISLIEVAFRVSAKRMVDDQTGHAHGVAEKTF